MGINSTEYMFVTMPEVPPVVDATPPASVTNLTNASYEPMNISWTWTDPADPDFDNVEVYIDSLSYGTVAKGVQSFNTGYFKPNSSHNISTRTLDTSNNVNTTRVNRTASTSSLFMYVFDFLIRTGGTVSDEENAKNASDGGVSAILSERIEGGINKSNRTKDPSKVITEGAQSGGSYIPGYLNESDGLIDVTKASEKQIKTVVYYMGQRENITDLAANNNFSGQPVAVYLPEQGIVVRTAWLELRQLSAITSAASVTTINMYLNGMDYSVIKGGTYQAQTGESLVTVARANVTQAFTGFTNPTTFTAAVKTGGASSNAHALLLYVTYEYDPGSPTQLRTVRYPLATKTGQIAAGTATNFTYIVSIPEAANIRSSWFEIRGKLDSASINDSQISARIAPNTTYSTGVSLDMALRDNYEFMYLFKTTPEFQINSAQTLTVRNQNQSVYTLGGEVIVTYEYSNAEPVQLKTVKYFVGQRTAIGGTILVSNSTTVFIPEQNINVKSVWARIRATYTSTTAGTHTIGGKIAGTTIINNSYTVDTNNALIGDYMIIYNMTNASSLLVNNTMVFVNNTFNRTNHGPPAIELYITYTYDPASPKEIKTVEYPAGQSASQATTRNENFFTFVPEDQTLIRGAYIDYITMCSRTSDYTTTSAIDTSFSNQTVNIDGTSEALAAGTMNNDIQKRITATSNIYSINYSSNATASFSGVAMLTYEFTRNYSVDAMYTFTETNSSDRWQSISIIDSSYGDTLANARIFNNLSRQWEALSLLTPFANGSTPAQHVNATVGESGNAGDYDAGSGLIKIRYNWTGSSYYNNSLGIDLINVTVNYMDGGFFRLNVTSNTTDVPENTSSQELQIRYYVSGDNFTLQCWNSSSSTWNNKTTLDQISLSHNNITILPEQLIQNGNFSGSPFSIRKYYVPVRYVGENLGVKGKLYLDYQRVKTS